MNTAQIDHQNHYAVIRGIRIFADYTNQRLKIPDCQFSSVDVIKDIIDYSRSQKLGKIISFCRIGQLKSYKACGFVTEGIISGYFNGEDAYCVSCFLDKQRQYSPRREEEDAVLRQFVKESGKFVPREKQAYIIRDADVSDIPQMINLFSTVFETYPSPVFSIEYLKRVMNDQVLFKVAVDGGKIVSIASADMNKKELNAEITDCATYPEYRGRGMLCSLILSLEAELRERGFVTAYSLSRAVNPGINKALSRMQYKYNGRLVNNCHICGGFEDMNIWVKNLGKDMGTVPVS
jgi:putative beta-lysine N-acetyltransferase